MLVFCRWELLEAARLLGAFDILGRFGSTSACRSRCNPKASKPDPRVQKTTPRKHLSFHNGRFALRRHGGDTAAGVRNKRVQWSNIGWCLPGMRELAWLSDPRGVYKWRRRLLRPQVAQDRTKKARVFGSTFFWSLQGRSRRHAIGSASEFESKRTPREVPPAHASVKRGREQIKNERGALQEEGQSSRDKEDGVKCQHMQSLRDQGAWREAPTQSCIYIYISTCICIYIYICIYVYMSESHLWFV